MLQRDPQIVCEECFKFWLHFLTPDQVRQFLNALINAINFESFGTADCVNAGEPQYPGAECLPKEGPLSSPQAFPQLFDICKQLELALQNLAKTLTPKEALDQIEGNVLSRT